MLKEFKEFAMRGNVLDLAIGVVIGTAFGKIVSSFVNDVLMPPIGKLLGGVDFSNLFIVLGPGEFESLSAAKDAGAATLNYGLFINNVIDFLIIAFAIFLLVKAVNRAMPKPAPAPAAELKDCPYCLSSIPAKATRCAHCTSAM
ncbi:MAG TPA: large-conductance mechanosensitive channel protein MscL [Candidatus Limnocylindria bacterium]|nr:large-conductance mechanosensitive channel protein MscL [Candidatus Limnocylindria bacterium]